jgi:hypothetical protein
MQVAAGTFLLIQRDQNSRGDSFFREARPLGLGSVAPYDLVRPGEQGDFFDPLIQGAALALKIYS